MADFSFFITEDRSTGLYSITTQDIFHSKTGALKEAYDKFINPCFLKEKLNKNKKLRILDVCSGVGYNLKAALNQIQDEEIIIDSIEIDKNFLFLSPFINDGINNDDLKIFLLNELCKNNFSLSDIINYNLSHIESENYSFFCTSMSNLAKFLSKLPYETLEQPQNYSFLHNIYYNYISNENIEFKDNKNYRNCHINYFIGDARKTIKTLSDKYDIIFFDAFSSQKDPTLWTINLLSIIKEKMHEDSILVSYSKSTPFRSALFELGFKIGKTYIDNIDMGTVCSLNKNFIINNLSDFDLKLLQTRSGIFYKDNCDLSLLPEEILHNREIEQNNSNRISHTKFLKDYNKNPDLL